MILWPVDTKDEPLPFLFGLNDLWITPWGVLLVINNKHHTELLTWKEQN